MITDVIGELFIGKGCGQFYIGKGVVGDFEIELAIGDGEVI